MSQEFRLKNIDETRKYFLEEIEQNYLVSRKHKEVCTTLNYIENFLILASAIAGCISILVFASLLGISMGVTISAIGLKSLDKNYNIFQTTRFNYTMIFFKLIN